ncbi:MAG: hypothetical protein CM15mV89_0300 [Caudoviricetes sp.]|nr:MAG: hypothetical protein CM15mV89_0300 [Caudoviricetes sp.]
MSGFGQIFKELPKMQEMVENLLPIDQTDYHIHQIIVETYTSLKRK